MTIAQTSIHTLKVKNIDGKEISLGDFKGKKLLIVNTASECGYTKQYADLEELYHKFKNKNFEIIAFPCNDFGGQEPGTAEEIKKFCSNTFKVSFPLMEKIEIKGSKKSEVYKWLTEKELNGVESSDVLWNFQKYLIDENGHLIKHLPSRVNPMSEEITNWLLEK